MSCYNCQSPKGTSTQLCTSCTEYRLRTKGQSTYTRSHGDYSSPSFLSRYSASQVVMFGVVGILGTFAALYVLCISPLGPGLAFSAEEHTYNKCVMKTGYLKKKMKLNTNSPTADMFVTALVSDIAVSFCDEMREKCRAGTRSSDCRHMMRFVESF